MIIEIEDLKKVSLNPGDVVIVKLAKHLTLKHCENIIKNLEGVFPDNKIILMTPDTDIEVVTPTE